MTREEQLKADLQEIMSRQPELPCYVLNDFEKDTATAVAWKESYETWSAEFDAKLKEIEEEITT